MIRRAAFLLSLWLGAGAASTLLASCSDDDFGQERPAADASATVSDDGGGGTDGGSSPDLLGVPMPDLIIPVSTDMATGDLVTPPDLTPGN